MLRLLHMLRLLRLLYVMRVRRELHVQRPSDGEAGLLKPQAYWYPQLTGTRPSTTTGGRLQGRGLGMPGVRRRQRHPHLQVFIILQPRGEP